jgi:Bacterial Ig-like domain/Glycosyl hydrolases family 16
MITGSRTFVASLLAAVTVGAFALLGAGVSGDPRAVAALSTDGDTAAAAHNWGPVVTGDEFNYVGVPDPLKWNVYNSVGHAGNGLREPAQVTVDGTKMVMNGTPNGTTAGMSAKFANQKYGRWEVRAAGSGDNEYHMVSILWPDSENWPCDGETDYAETTGDWNVIQFFHHYSCSNSQTSASMALDVSQFHNYAIDWSPAGITGYVDGVQWFQDNTASHQPPGSMHQTLQLDWFPDSTPDGAAEMRVDWVRVYAAAGTPNPGDTTAPTVMSTSPASGATAVAVAANVTGTFSEAMDASTVTPATFTLTAGTGTTVPAAVTYNSTDKVATLNPGADLAAGTTYTATIKGGTSGVKDAAGNALAADRTWTFTTAAPAGGTSETITLTATADSYVTSGATTTNFGTSTILGVDNSPIEATYLKFNLSAYAGRTLESATLQLRSAGSGSTGKQNVKLVTNDTWTETGITYSNRPAPGTSIGTLGPTTTNTNYTIPLTVTGLTGELGQQLSLALDSSSSDGLDLNSKEAGTAAAPKLVIRLKQ